MSEKLNDGGPAFPRTGEGFGNPKYDTPGMTLRDWFAGQALGAVVSATSKGTHHPKYGEQFDTQNIRLAMAVDAYDLADAMLEARSHDR